MQILLVEDDAASRELLERCLISHHYDVATAGDLRSAVDWLGKKQFDVIISDIALPDGTGYALINQAQRRGIHALFIAVSAYPFPSDVQEPGLTGFQYHLVKPINCDHLCSLLTENRDGDTSQP